MRSRRAAPRDRQALTLRAIRESISAGHDADVAAGSRVRGNRRYAGSRSGSAIRRRSTGARTGAKGVVAVCETRGDAGAARGPRRSAANSDEARWTDRARRRDVRGAQCVRGDRGREARSVAAALSASTRRRAIARGEYCDGAVTAVRARQPVLRAAGHRAQGVVVTDDGKPMANARLVAWAASRRRYGQPRHRSSTLWTANRTNTAPMNVHDPRARTPTRLMRGRGRAGSSGARKAAARSSRARADDGA